MSLSPINLFIQGGAFMWPLLVLSLLALTLIFERMLFFSKRRYSLHSTLDVLKQKPDTVQPNNPLMHIGQTIMRESAGGIEHVKNVAAREASQLISSYERGIRLLGLIGMIAPLIGLLGTVWGMVLAFAKMAELGDQVTAGDFANGIWTALLTTVGGLIVAIPAVAATRIFEGKVDLLAHDLNATASHLHEWIFGPESAHAEQETILPEP